MAKRSEKTVLFLCTGNYYRSRFAEVLFLLLLSLRRPRQVDKGPALDNRIPPGGVDDLPLAKFSDPLPNLLDVPAS